MDELHRLFEKEVKQIRQISSKNETVVKAMQVYVQSLSKYARLHKNPDKDVNGFITQLLVYDINPREFLYKKLFKITKANNYIECLNEVKEIKTYLDKIADELKNNLINKTRNIINHEYKGSLTQALKMWIDSLSQDVINKSHDMTTNKVVRFINEIETNDDMWVINRLANIITGLSIEDWQDNTADIYINDLIKIVDLINDSEKNYEDSDSTIFRVETKPKWRLNQKKI